MSHREIRELVAELEPRPDVAPSVRKLAERPAPGSASPLQLGAPRVEPDAIKLESDAVTLEARVPAARPAAVEPFAPTRYQVRFTASAQLREKLECLQALMRSSVPDGDLARIGYAPSSRHIPAAVRRRVHERDGGRCAYRDKYGRRCDKCHGLEFHHKQPFAHGGDHSPANLTLKCRAHDTLLAEQDYGEDVMARFRAATSRTSVPVDAHGARIAERPRSLSSG